jgi:hypothetical protein
MNRIVRRLENYRDQRQAHHPEKLWPEIDVEWQREEMPREQAGQSDLPSRPA